MCPTLQSAPHAKTHSGGVTLTERRILRRRRHRDVTKRRTLGGRRHGKPHFACGPHQKAHSACGRSGRVRLSVRVRAQNALFRRMCFSLPAQTRRRLTENRTLHPSPHGKAQSAPATSRKTALCTRHLTENRTLYRRCHLDVAKRRILDGRRHGKPHSARGPHQKAHSACERWLRREPIFAGLCTLLHTHGRSRDRAGPRVPRRRRPHGPRDARALGPEVHATGAVTQPPTHTNSRSLI